jgi:hypothetical protein
MPNLSRSGVVSSRSSLIPDSGPSAALRDRGRIGSGGDFAVGWAAVGCGEAGASGASAFAIRFIEPASPTKSPAPGIALEPASRGGGGGIIAFEPASRGGGGGIARRASLMSALRAVEIAHDEGTGAPAGCRFFIEVQRGDDEDDDPERGREADAVRGERVLPGSPEARYP